MAAVRNIFASKRIGGIGAVDNEWGANEMYLWVMNTEWLYNRYRDRIAKLRSYTWGDKKLIINRIMTMLQRDIRDYNIPLESGMGRGEKARKMAAEDIYNAFVE